MVLALPCKVTISSRDLLSLTSDHEGTNFDLQLSASQSHIQPLCSSFLKSEKTRPDTGRGRTLSTQGDMKAAMATHHDERCRQGKQSLTMFFNPTTTQTRATNVACTPDKATPLIAKVPPAAVVDNIKKATPTNPKERRVCVEGIHQRGRSPSRKLA